MNKTRFAGQLFKWSVILGAIYIGSTMLHEQLSFETRTTYLLLGLVLAISYVESSLKDRIERLEYRLDEHNRKLNGGE